MWLLQVVWEKNEHKILKAHCNKESMTHLFRNAWISPRISRALSVASSISSFKDSMCWLYSSREEQIAVWWRIKGEIFNTLRPRQNGRHFPNDIFKWIFLNDNIWFSINISLECVPEGQIKNIPPLVQIMAWRRPGDKPLSEPMMFSLPTHIWVTQPQRVNSDFMIHYLSLQCISNEIDTEQWYNNFSNMICHL